MNKRLLTFVVTGTALALGALSPSVNAQDIDSQISSANSQIQNLNNQKQAVASQVDQLSQDLSNVQSRINSVQAEQETAKANLEVLKAEISKLETLIAERNERLKDQARAVQVNGSRSYLDFLLNADSITDVVNRIGVIVDLVGANRQLMQEQARDKEQVETKEQAQKANLAQQEANEAQLQNLQSELSATFNKHKATLANLSNEELEAIAARDGLVQEKERLAAEKARADAEKAAAQKAAEAAKEAMLKATEESVAQAAATPAAATVSIAAKSATPAKAANIVVGGSFAAPNPSFVAALNGGYFGQCTYYVYNRFAQLGSPIRTTGLGNAAEWPANAAAAGYGVSSTPRAGTAIVFQRGVGGADPVYGHVGFVERVNADGSLFISEMNVQGVNVISTRTIPAGVAAQATYINFGL
ncbi:coiled-coil domain-containing protein [Granulicatella elegans]|uniref:coiled-coil domain-containing protein n=1 Tax=Granulicatella elegans TaxID=137732 RepID=UPI000AA628B5|nr:CHAP domain-containing protein [Granulicatella elegans]UEA32092.1 CHAP domain-containing protein [Granulicatella elegans]